MNTKKWWSFFKEKSVRYTFAFPKSCFKGLENHKSFELAAKLKGKVRNFVFQGREYNDFFNLSEIKLFLKNWKSLPYRIQKSNFKSFTNIYFNNEISDFLTSKKTYSLEMYERWRLFVNTLKRNTSLYKYKSYIDIADYYNNIYAHLLGGLNAKNIEHFKKIQNRESDISKKYIKNNEWLFIFQKEFYKRICIFQRTKGIPLGNGLSDFAAEQYILLLEYFIFQVYKKLKFEYIRYRDDIYIFSNKKRVNEKIYEIFLHFFPIFQLNINDGKSIKTTTKQNFSQKWYQNEEDYKNKLIKTISNSDIIYVFTKKYSKSNKIFSLLKYVYINKNLNRDNLLKNLINTFNKSQTNIIPWVIAIMEKWLNIDDYTIFVKKINKNLLTESDKIWLWCYEKKHKIHSIIHSKIEKIIKEHDLAKYFSDKKINFYKDVDSFAY